MQNETLSPATTVQDWLEIYAKQMGIGLPNYTYTKGLPWFSWKGYSFTVTDRTRLKITKTVWETERKGYFNYAFIEVNALNAHKHINEHFAELERVAGFPLIKTIAQEWNWSDGEPVQWTDAEQREVLAYYNIVHTHVDITDNVIRRVFTLQLKGE